MTELIKGLRRAAILASCFVALAFSFPAAGARQQEPAATKPPLTFQAFFHAVSIGAVRMEPDGEAVVIETERPDYAHNRFRTDLWLYRVAEHRLAPLTTSGHDFDPQWSPDGQWIAFLSDRAGHGPQLYVISARGGGADLLTYAGAGGVHTYAWAPDS